MSTLLQFVEASTNQGIYNSNTGSSRVSTIRKIIYGLNLANTDIDDVDANELVTRYAHKFPGKLKSASLNIYRIRLAKSIEEFKRYHASPADFKPQRHRIKKDTDASINSGQTTDKSKIVGIQDSLDSSVVINDAANETINPTIRLRLRPNAEIAITGLPIDLTPAEYNRIAALVKVFTIVEGDQ